MYCVCAAGVASRVPFGSEIDMAADAKVGRVINSGEALAMRDDK